MNTSEPFDIVVVGAGPAGIAAACVAAEAGRRVGLVDDNPAPGGQIWRGEAGKSGGDPLAAAWLARLAAAPVTFLPSTRVIARPRPGLLRAETPSGPADLEHDRLILAPGARERLLPFPGWTLPNVMAAGGLQAMVKSGLPIAGKTVVVAGSGPLLLAVAAYLRSKGAAIPIIAEQAPWPSLVRFGVGLVGTPGKLMQAVALRGQLGGVPYRAGCWPVAARGDEALRSVTLSDGRRTREVACDYLACGFGLVPATELPRLMGCAVRAGVVTVDRWQQTSVEGVACAGEPTGIGGVDRSLVEGQIAGLAVAGRLDDARRLLGERDRAWSFAGRLERAFDLRPELRELAGPETIACRCEDVTLGQLAPFDSAREAKLHTRCGMGPCQGRVCGPALAFLRGWDADTVRPPVFPARIGSLLEPEATS